MSNEFWHTGFDPKVTGISKRFEDRILMSADKVDIPSLGLLSDSVMLQSVGDTATKEVEARA